MNAGSLYLYNNSYLEVGRSGYGQLIQTGGTISVPAMYVAHSAGSTGVYKNISGHTEVLGTLEIGRLARAAMVVEAGGVLTSFTARIGNNSSSNGVAMVTGANSLWATSSELAIGVSGVGDLTIADGGRVTSFTASIGSELAGIGAVTITGAGSEWTNESNMYVGGNATQAGGIGVIDITSGGRVFAQQLRTWSSGTINLKSGELESPSIDITQGTFRMTGGRLASQIIAGNLTSAGGRLAPFGDLTGNATISGSYSQQSGATLELGLAGTATDAFDALDVGSLLSIGGQLSVSLIDGFSPSIHDYFDLLDWGSLSGGFSTVTLPALAAGLAWNTSQLYTTGVLSVGLAGDYNNNGAVDAADYILWRKGAPLANEVDAPGTVSFPDYTAWRARFGNTSGLGANGTANASTVPEPAPVFLLGVATACARCARQKRLTLAR